LTASARRAETLSIIAGHDPLDSTSSRVSVDDYAADIDTGVKGLRFGIVREAVEKLEGEVRANFDAAVEILRGGGATVEFASIPTIGYAIAIYYIVANAEAARTCRGSTGFVTDIAASARERSMTSTSTRAAKDSVRR
jgi:Asp-tRNA(Asn)/Glu-tRNA(Gln) amidotransferase A subunit family amidase